MRPLESDSERPAMRVSFVTEELRHTKCTDVRNPSLARGTGAFPKCDKEKTESHKEHRRPPTSGKDECLAAALLAC